MVTGRDMSETPCTVTMDNVFIRRERGENEFRVSAKSRVTARRISLLNLKFQATGGDVQLDHCFVGGTVPPANSTTDTPSNTPPSKVDMLLWKDVTWRGNDNLYDVGSLRFDKTSFTPATSFHRSMSTLDGGVFEGLSVVELAG